MHTRVIQPRPPAPRPAAGAGRGPARPPRGRRAAAAGRVFPFVSALKNVHLQKRALRPPRVVFVIVCY
jgi:hypothetical protein